MARSRPEAYQQNDAQDSDLDTMGRLLFQRLEFKPGSEWIVGDTHALRFSQDGDLEFWDVDQRELLWHAGTHGEKALMQGDGNLVIYGRSESALWSSGTFGYPDAVLAAGDDGSLVILTADLAHTLWCAEPLGDDEGVEPGAASFHAAGVT